jgi:hypothetical protein
MKAHLCAHITILFDSKFIFTVGYKKQSQPVWQAAGALNDNFNAEENIANILNRLSVEEKIMLGFELKDLVVDCQIAGVGCDFNTDFEFFYNPTLGNCYAFNSGWNGKNPYVSNVAGTINGKSVFAHIISLSMMITLSTVDGANVLNLSH